jgi:membrane protease YdiL (CAAX protease family)
VGADPGLEEFRPIVGNLQLALIFIALSWVLAAFGEEMVYRGYLMQRVAGAGGSWVAALIVATLVFGYAHAPGQGLSGALQEGLSGLWLGLLFLASQRTLAVPIIAHGVANTLAFVLIYLGRYPGV